VSTTSRAKASDRPRLSLTVVFFVGAAILAAIAAAAFVAFVQSSRASVLSGAERARANAAARAIERVLALLDVADDVVRDLDRALEARAADPTDALSLEPLLFTTLLARDDIAEITFIHADLQGWAGDDPDAKAVVGADHRWALSIVRASPDADSPIQSIVVSQRAPGGPFAARVRARPPHGTFGDTPFADAPGAATDPTTPLTFATIVRRDVYARAFPTWSDLHWFELDSALPEHSRRVTLSAMEAVKDASGAFLGVVRVSMRAESIDGVGALKVFPNDPDDPDVVFLSDDQGRLVTCLCKSDHLVSTEGELRVPLSDTTPPEVKAALASPALGDPRLDQGPVATTLDVAGKPYLATFVGIRQEDWRVAIVGPEAYYTKDLRALQRGGLGALGLVFLVALGAGALGLRALRRGLGEISERTARMRAFDFTPSPGRSRFRDIDDVVDGLERAKTVTRALGKYVPVDLVRTLFEENKDPSLGGELRPLSIMFTDIKDFTSHAERVAPDVLARALGKYLDAMTRAVDATGGTIDKFIGDAVMAFWNAPEPHQDHATRACRAALACKRATEALYASPEWTELPPLVTRCGLHTAEVMVGHFGAPSRLSYTAIGDGVNLASRLEGLCKQYGLTMLASEAIVTHAKGFVFRLVDRVAVKGKSRAVLVYELLGEEGTCDAALPVARAYEEAFRAYEKRDFARARSVLAAHVAADGPSRALDARCAAYEAEAPPDDWDAVAHSQEK
jgi:adenylate cyclase